MAISRRVFLKTTVVAVGTFAFAGLLGCTSNNATAPSDAAQGTASGVASPVAFPNMVGEPSDYANRDNWMHFADAHQHDVDVFWIYPTVYIDAAAGKFAEITATAMREQAQTVYKVQGSVFEGLGDVYVPYYRQLNGAKFTAMNGDDVFEACHELPRTDLYAALDYFFDNVNEERPFILAGHSQGSLMLNIILREYFKAHADRLERMVAAYQIGYSLTKDMLADNPALKAATCADDTGVIASWNTEGPASSDAGTTYVLRENSIAINPLNWKTDDTYAGVELNRGSLVPDASGTYALREGMADARIDVERGVVVCTTADRAMYAIPAERAFMFGPESYHSYDYGFYYANIRENAALRIEKWLAANR